MCLRFAMERPSLSTTLPQAVQVLLAYFVTALTISVYMIFDLFTETRYSDELHSVVTVELEPEPFQTKVSSIDSIAIFYQSTFNCSL